MYCMSKPEDQIPVGWYCYTIESIEKETGRMRTNVCKYWSIRDGKPKQENGYCDYLGWGDWEMGTVTLLWDQVKECGVNCNNGPGEHQITTDGWDWCQSCKELLVSAGEKCGICKDNATTQALYNKNISQ